MLRVFRDHDSGVFEVGGIISYNFRYYGVVLEVDNVVLDIALNADLQGNARKPGCDFRLSRKSLGRHNQGGYPTVISENVR
jgi:hypothetical protein